MMKTFYNLIVIIPVGPGCSIENIEDTIESFIHYTQSSFKIIIADDSQKGTATLLKDKIPGIDVVTTPKSMGKLCGLYVTLSMAFRQALEKYRFEAVLRLDTDALVIGPAPEMDALTMFRNHPEIGIAGQYPYDYYGDPWDKKWPRKQVFKLITYRFFTRPLAHLVLTKHFHRARRNGYKRGESVFGGACFYSELFLLSLNHAGLLPDLRLQSVELEEDHLFALLAKSAGFSLGDLCSGSLPMGCAWKGLPVSPVQLIKDGKKIIHSTRYWNDMNEDAIRIFFKKYRNKETMKASDTTTIKPSVSKPTIHG